MELIDIFYIYKTDPNRALSLMVRHHIGLVEKICHSRPMWARVVPGEELGYMAEAMPFAVAEYDPKQGAASTMLAKVIWRLIMRDRRLGNTIASIRVPCTKRPKHRITKVCINDTDERILHMSIIEAYIS